MSHKREGIVKKINNRSVYRTIMRAYNACAPTPPLLMAPCSHGWFFDWFRRDGVGVVGIDIEKHRVEEARARVSPPMETIEGNILEMPFADNQFEFVVCNRFILHFNDKFKAKAMKELARVTRRWLLVHYDYKYSIRQFGRLIKAARTPKKDFSNHPGYRIWKREGRKLRYDRKMMAQEGQAAGLRIRKLYFVSYLISERVYCLYEK